MKVIVHAPRSVPKTILTVIRKTAKECVRHLPKRMRAKLSKRHSLEVSLVTPIAIKKLNRQYRKKNRPTDVLSFSRWEGMAMPVPEVGDVLICWAVAKEQARENGLTVATEVARLTAHGVLHLFGYDHERSQRDAKIMFRLEEKILRGVVGGT